MIEGQRPNLRGVASDLDGTLPPSDGTFSPLTLAMLTSARRRAVPFVIATARTPRAIRKIVGYEQLGLVVGANGAIVWDAASDVVLEEYCVGADGVGAAVADLRRTLPAVGIALLSAQTMFLDETYVSLRGKGAAGATVIRDVHDVVPANRIVVVSLRHRGRSAKDFIGPVARAFDRVGVASCAGTSTVDVVPLGFNKAETVERILGGTGCSLKEVVVFGDMPNDLKLFTMPGWACAVANAHPSMIAAANEIVARNDDDGVALTVQRVFDL